MSEAAIRLHIEPLDEGGFVATSPDVPGLVRKGDVTLMMRLIEGEFPNYRQVIPNEITQTLTLPSEPLVRALRRVALLSAERSQAAGVVEKLQDFFLAIWRKRLLQVSNDALHRRVHQRQFTERLFGRRIVTSLHI